MTQSSVIHVRVDNKLKKEVEILFADLGLDTPSAIRLFLKQSIAQNGIPFPLVRQEGFYNPHNIAHLKKVLADLEAGDAIAHDLIEEDDNA